MKHKDHFMKLYQPHHQRLCAYVQAMVRNREDARDMIAEVVLRALERFHTLKEESKFLFFLFGIARNVFAEKLRYQKRFGHSLPDSDTEQTSTEDNHHWELHHLLSQLTEPERQRLVLFNISGFSYKEIAELTGEEEHKVKSGLFETRQKLKASIKEEAQLLKQLEREHVYGK